MEGIDRISHNTHKHRQGTDAYKTRPDNGHDPMDFVLRSLAVDRQASVPFGDSEIGLGLTLMTRAEAMSRVRRPIKEPMPDPRKVRQAFAVEKYIALRKRD